MPFRLENVLLCSDVAAAQHGDQERICLGPKQAEPKEKKKKKRKEKKLTPLAVSGFLPRSEASPRPRTPFPTNTLLVPGKAPEMDRRFA